MELSGVKTERRRMTMVSLEALRSLSSGETRLSVANSLAMRRGFVKSSERVILMARFLHVFKPQPPCRAPRSSCLVSMFGPLGRLVYLDFGR
ncbi:hypothetical protein Bca52824_071515 [Brassica carinata]|uniref:Uncharacterized protein n=1 Tax=Brassica carinata TaxID=52824 RepID=A0A8X7U4U5_BRACI|nr:hypothetical protein Bca52824_071515 [Brassica carinata]